MFGDRDVLQDLGIFRVVLERFVELCKTFFDAALLHEQIPQPATRAPVLRCYLYSPVQHRNCIAPISHLVVSKERKNHQGCCTKSWQHRSGKMPLLHQIGYSPTYDDKQTYKGRVRIAVSYGSNVDLY